MPKDTLNDTVDSTVDKLLENEGFQSKLADMIGGALAKAAEPAPQEKSVSQVVFETLGHHTKKPEIGNPLGAAVIAAYHGKGDPDRAARFAKAKWGNGNDVQKMFDVQSSLATHSVNVGQNRVDNNVVVRNTRILYVQRVADQRGTHDGGRGVRHDPTGGARS